MKHIIDGTLFERAKAPYAYDLRIHDLGHGQTEATVLPRYAWSEVGPLTPQALLDHEMSSTGHRWTPEGWVLDVPTEQQQLDLIARNRERSARRARTKVRRLAKFKGLNTMFTLTYRENMLDRARMARDLDVFIKRVRRIIPSFEYIAVFERQKRGAWHAHIATRRVLTYYVHGGALVKSYDLLRAVWRAVVGQDNGTCNVMKRTGKKRHSPAQLAAYLSKYIGKTLDQAEKHVNSYSASGRDLPDAFHERVICAGLIVARDALYDLLGPELARSKLYDAHLDGGGYYLSLCPAPS